jgi:uncharacterized Zn finger protein
MRRHGRWEPYGDPDGGWEPYPPAAPKLPPPEHGIRVRKFGGSWWSERWIAALERLGASYAARLRRGRSYARQGRVHDLAVKGSTVTALVTGSRADPYQVRLRLAPLADAAWEAVIEAMGAKARFAAALLAGEMPPEVEGVFRAAGASLFPDRARELATECSCPDWANPCKHVAAVHYVLGEAFDRNPFLLLELRGRDREAILARLRAARAGPAAAAEEGATRADAGGLPAVALSVVTAESYERLGDGALDLRFHIGEPAAAGAVLRQLGSPPSWTLRSAPAELLQPAVAAAAARARELALGPPADAAVPPAERPATEAARRPDRPRRRGPA